MISEQIESFWESLFDIKNDKTIADISSGSVLKLPLERNALEQTKYATWLYGDGLKNTIANIKRLQVGNDSRDVFQFDYSSNTFLLSKPEGLASDDFYFLFDYIKEVFIDNDYRITNAVKEGISMKETYAERERYVLINSYSHHLVKLEVIKEEGKAPKMIGLGYPIDHEASNHNDPNFFKIIKQMFK
jgi:hypothetical protein